MWGTTKCTCLGTEVFEEFDLENDIESKDVKPIGSSRKLCN